MLRWPKYRRALTHERVMAGLAAAKQRGRRGGRHPRRTRWWYMSKAAVFRTLGVKRTTLLETLVRVGWPAANEVMQE